MLREAMDTHRRWVLSGSLCGWGDVFIPHFELVVVLWIPKALRMARLRERELRRYGEAAISPSGKLHASSTAFLSWAAQYDEAGYNMRSRVRHEAWLAALPCPVFRLGGDMTTEAQVAELVARGLSVHQS